MFISMYLVQKGVWNKISKQLTWSTVMDIRRSTRTGSLALSHDQTIFPTGKIHIRSRFDTCSGWLAKCSTNSHRKTRKLHSNKIVFASKMCYIAHAHSINSCAGTSSWDLHILEISQDGEREKEERAWEWVMLSLTLDCCIKPPCSIRYFYNIYIHSLLFGEKKPL